MTSKENGVELTCGTALQTGGRYSCGAEAYSARGGAAITPFLVGLTLIVAAAAVFVRLL